MNREYINLLRFTALAGMHTGYSDNNVKKSLLFPKNIPTKNYAVSKTGMKFFDIDGVQIEALNYKSALKKAKKLKI